jgi:hypothetical protein
LLCLEKACRGLRAFLWGITPCLDKRRKGNLGFFLDTKILWFYIQFTSNRLLGRTKSGHLIRGWK